MKHLRCALFVILNILLYESVFSQTSVTGSTEKTESATRVPVYARANPDSVLVASDDVWYLEELDHNGRPKSAVRWIEGVATEKIFWTYDSESQQPVQKTVTVDKTATSEALITETGYDDSGNEVFIRMSTLDGALVEKTENSWTQNNLLEYTVYTKDEMILRTEYVYGKANELTEKKILRNGELELHSKYETKDTWTEEVYYKGRKILTVRYENGIRLGNHNER